MEQSQTKWFKWEWLTLVGLCLLSHADAHILVYKKDTNRLIEEYNDLPAQFGPQIPPNGIKVYAIPASTKTTHNDYACSPIMPPPGRDYDDNARFVAIIQRGGDNCSFELKVRYAQLARFDAVIVYNNDGEDLEQMSAKNSSGINIPAVFVGHTTGVNLLDFYSKDVVLVINDELPFNINTQLILPFSILIGLCFLIMIFYMIYKCIREERRLRRYRLPKRMLKKLPILKYTKNNDLSYDTCVICLDDFVEGDKLRVLPCRHPYHSQCIDPWLTENRRVCPICKRKVFMKGEARTNRNRQSSLDSVTDTDDDTTPLLQPSNATAANAASMAAAGGGGANSASNHGTFRRDRNANSAVEIVSDDENALLSQQSPAHSSRRVNPFDRTPNLPPNLTPQSNGGFTRRWTRSFLSLFRRGQNISVAAPPFLEAAVPSPGRLAGGFVSSPVAAAVPASNNVLNPNLSGSFNNDDDDDEALPRQSIYEPVEVVVRTLFQRCQPPSTAAVAVAGTPVEDGESPFLQTPTHGAIGVAALPNHFDRTAPPPPPSATTTGSSGAATTTTAAATTANASGDRDRRFLLI